MISSDTPRLTTLSSASGCGCKIAPKTLEAILLQEVQLPLNDNLIVGNDTRDDAAILKVTDTHALIATTDFFTPIVDDPYDWGYIAAANALSDVYAMGGKPMLALAILGWPADLDTQIAALVMKGGRDACASVGIPVAGGHSIHSKEPFYGLTVNGWIATAAVKKNDGANPGDLIFMTKPLGTGILTAAAKRNQVQTLHLDEAIRWMKKINTEGEQLGALSYVTAMTDITGFGLLGHMHEMCGNTLTACIQLDAIPKMEAALTYAAQFIFPDNTWRNWQAYASETNLQDESIMPWICDPQTNGGLLITLSPEHESELLDFWSTLNSDALLVKIGHMEARTSELRVQVIQD
jgi:selenide, water dikinase